jgi:hypothetical protein
MESLRSLKLKLRTCNLFSSLFCVKCEPIRMRYQIILILLKKRDVASHVCGFYA